MGSKAADGEYRSFLLRLWRERGESATVWRCSLEDAGSRARRGFDGLESLASYLAELCGELPRASSAGSAEEVEKSSE